jgi:hypothetical protein
MRHWGCLKSWIEGLDLSSPPILGGAGGGKVFLFLIFKIDVKATTPNPSLEEGGGLTAKTKRDNFESNNKRRSHGI